MKRVFAAALLTAMLSSPAAAQFVVPVTDAATFRQMALFTRYARAGDDPAMVSFARQTLPHLRSHLASARRM